MIKVCWGVSWIDVKKTLFKDGREDWRQKKTEKDITDEEKIEG